MKNLPNAKSFLFLLSIIPLMIFQSCEKINNIDVDPEDVCKGLAIADLILEAITPIAQTQLPDGIEYELVHDITNSLAWLADCNVACGNPADEASYTAPENTHQQVIYYNSSQNNSDNPSDWGDPVNTTETTVDPLKGCQLGKAEYLVKFLVDGYYLVESIADAYDVVEEGNEDNNTETKPFGRTERTIIHVKGGWAEPVIRNGKPVFVEVISSNFSY